MNLKVKIHTRILARKLAQVLTKEELKRASGGAVVPSYCVQAQDDPEPY